MLSFRLNVNILGAVVLALVLTPLTYAQATRTWVSGVGSDTNPCSRTAPCKTFAGAITQTAAGGEIDCLDPGGFGGVTISMSITIDCDSGAGGVLVSGTSGIVISAATTDTIILRNLAINGSGNGVHGISILSAKSVHLDDLDIYGFGTSGINVGAGAATQLTVHDSKISECVNGIIVNTSSGNATVDISNTQIFNTTTGISAQNGSRIFIRDSDVFFNNNGVLQNSLGGGGSVVTAVNTTFFFSNTAALQSASGAFIIAYGNSFINDVLAFSPSGGQIFTGQDNIASGSATGSANGGLAPKI